MCNPRCVRKVVLECWLVPAFLLVACTPGRAPLPPGASIYPTDEAHDAFDTKLPGDATHVAVPAWASLEEVWGTYDPPFMNALHGPKTVVFGDDDRSLVMRVWSIDTAKHERRLRPSNSLANLPLRIERGHRLRLSMHYHLHLIAIHGHEQHEVRRAQVSDQRHVV